MNEILNIELRINQYFYYHNQVISEEAHFSYGWGWFGLLHN